MSKEYYCGYASICSYVRNRNENCSFREFVDFYQEIIINSPPNTDDWSGLEAAWETRFLRTVKDIIPEKYDDIYAKVLVFGDRLAQVMVVALLVNDRLTSEYLVKSETSNKSLMYYWQNIINEKGQKSVINNHISGSLKILDATAKHNTNTIVSKVSDLTSYKDQEIDVDAERLESDDDFQPPTKPSAKRKKQLSISKKNKESINSIASKKVKLTNADTGDPIASNSQSTGAGSIREINVVNSPRNDRPSTPSHQIYSTTKNQELLNLLNQEKQRSKSAFEPICSNIIDTTNELLMERLKIKRDYKWVPVINKATEYINELINNSDTRNEFRSKLQLSFVPPDETYSFIRHYEIHWVHRFADKLSLFFEAPRNPLLDRNSEGWLNCHILTSLIDDCFLTCEGIQVHRGEEMSLASTQRKNLSREESGKKQSGHKIDILFRIDNMEYFGSETYTDEDPQNSKPISYKKKLFREMKDQLDRLLKSLKFTKESIKEVKNIVLHGLTHGGLDGKMYAMYYDADIGYYFVFKTCQYRIGTTWDSIPESLVTLKDVLCLKYDIINVLDVVKKVKSVAFQTRPEDLFTIDNLPETTSTPKKSQKE
ncbi:12338_t:CDS:10 [Ambispora leptoticha]|uniref:12338_t:CDS:1 n=1 Tax=Ambispora leptoticha TaxID=144679 RepID=A0A9N8WD48_9GLOM|nr:12338_t:CDS:10 [Ambispora leptoticha]